MPEKTFLNLPEKKRERVTRVLIKHFARKPYSKVDIEDVAKESRVSKGSMYQYFKDKKDMYFYAIRVALGKYLEIVEDVNFENTSFFEYVKKGFEHYWNFLLTDKDACLLIEKSALYDDSPHRKEIEEMYHSKSREILKNIILKNQKAGFIRDDINPEIIMVFIDGASWNLKKALLKIAQEKGVSVHKLSKESIKKAQDEFMRLLKEGIAPNSKKV